MKRTGIVYPGDREARKNATPENSRFLKVFNAFEALDAKAEPVIYHDDFFDEVKEQLSRMDAALVWVNPIEDGRDRSKLDAMLSEISRSGIFVSTHPDVIKKLGTKEVLVQTRELGCGSDTYVYATLDQMRRELPGRLSKGETRVLKQYRGHSGNGIWKIEREATAGDVADKSPVRVRHAKSGCGEEVITLVEFFERCIPYFEALDGQGRMIDQAYQTRLPEGMIRCYLVGGKVEGFGRQDIVALHPTLAPTQRNYHPWSMPEFQYLKQLLEDDWVPAMQQILNISDDELPILWDCDFLFGPKDAKGLDTYVLCEINVSSVSPFPDSAIEPLVKAVLAK
jgi:hypothetical protein